MKKLPIRIEPETIAGKTKPIAKLLSILAETFGRPTSPDSIKNVMDVISNDAIDSIEKRGVDVFINTLGQKQHNVESIINKSFKFLPPEVVSPEMPDQEWVLDFFDLCQNCSNEEVQEIWAKLLADKVDNPKAHSRRLMHTIKLLEVIEARIFNNMSKCFCELTLGGGDEELDDLGLNFGTVWVAGDTVVIEEEDDAFKIDYDTCLTLEEIGLLSNKEYFGEDDILSEIAFLQDGKKETYQLQNATISIFEFTKIGHELFKVANHELNPAYKNLILSKLAEADMLKT